MLNKKALAASVSAPPAQFIEDVFSTFVYTGTSSAQNIVNGIDLAGKGGLAWIKCRTVAESNSLFTTALGANKTLLTNTNEPQDTVGTDVFQSFNSDGFRVGNHGRTNESPRTYASWTFRKQPKFFDVVTYTGTGSARTVAHNLGSVPGMIIVKVTDNYGGWLVYHRSLGATKNLVLNETYAETTSANEWNNTAPTSSVFTVGTTDTNESGRAYVAYLFAHDAGGFGTAGTDNVISCGSFSGASLVTLGYEPQWVLIRRIDTVADWRIFDTMRGFDVSAGGANLSPNSSAAETVGSDIRPSATGFTPTSFPSGTYIYMAIRRPMKVPTTGTSVFGLNARTGTGANATVTGGQVDDAVLIKNRGSAVASLFSSRLTGTGYLVTSSTAAEVAAGTTILQANPWDVMDGVKVGTTSTITNASGDTFINYLFKRASGFFDVVCFSGTDAVRTINHNLGVAPELMIVKCRSAAGSFWTVYSQPTGNTDYLYLDGTSPTAAFSGYWNNTSPTASVFTLGTGNGDDTNATGQTYVSYLFATCAGVSKVGTYTGNGSNQTINCGFTAGARFVLIKRTDSTGDWCVFDTARGIVSGNDPFLQLNSTAAEVTGEDALDPANSGFIVNETTEALNTNAATYIFLAIS